MKIEILELEKNDIVMVSHNIATVLPSDVDEYCKKLLPKLIDVFGEGRVALFPVREGETWEFTIIRRVI